MPDCLICGKPTQGLYGDKVPCCWACYMKAEPGEKEKLEQALKDAKA